GLDNDCDGDIDLDAVDATAWYSDLDGDLYGDPAAQTLACLAPADTVANALDCDDAHASAKPGGTEVCDGLDNDCDGDIDLDAVDALRWFADADADGHGDPATGARSCDAPAGAILDGTDCDDASADRFPGNQEVCDGLDNDCDGTPDDNAADAGTWYTDVDDDGYGLDGTAVRACAQPELSAPRGGDCDDTTADRFPANPEVCDGVDNDCDGDVDDSPSDAVWYYQDLDRDGFAGSLVKERACAAPGSSGWYLTAEDCDDVDRAVHPGADERCNGYDDDCDTEIDEDAAVDAPEWFVDADLDGYGSPSATAPACALRPGLSAWDTDCDDGAPRLRPDSLDIPGDGVDQDCDGVDTVAEVYFASRDHARLTALEADTGRYRWSIPGLTGALGVATAEDGRIWVTRQDAGGSLALVNETRDGVEDVLTGMGELRLIWWDASTETLLMVELSAGAVLEVDPATGAVDELIAGLDNPYQALRLPGQEEVYVSLASTPALLVLSPSTGDTRSIPLPLPAAGLALDGAAGLYLSTGAEGDLLHLDLGTEVATTVYDHTDGTVLKRWGLCPHPDGASLLSPVHDTTRVDRFFTHTEALTRFSLGQLNTPIGCASNALYDADEDGYTSALYGGEDCDDLDPDIHPGAAEGCDEVDRDCDGSPGGDADLDGYSDSACGGSDPDDGDPATHPGDGVHPDGASCADVLDRGLSRGTGRYLIDPDGDGLSDEAWCDMVSDGGGWTLVGTVVNDGARHWNSLAAWTDASTFGALDDRVAHDYKSPLFSSLEGTDLLVDTGEYAFSMVGPLALQSLAGLLSAEYDASACSTDFIHTGADWSDLLSPQAEDMLGLVVRPWDNNASCFPSGNENNILGFLFTNAWTYGLGNTPSGQGTWITHDNAMPKLSAMTPTACAGGYPCNSLGYRYGGTTCYDTSCKTAGTAVYVR
ncbi:MAG: hypothetical protein JXX28_17475, partial [Deltaproteobacteria bacterium]|nr:hypothetical protein [Deltaproteobacteria bacterium]